MLAKELNCSRSFVQIHLPKLMKKKIIKKRERNYDSFSRFMIMCSIEEARQAVIDIKKNSFSVGATRYHRKKGHKMKKSLD